MDPRTTKELESLLHFLPTTSSRQAEEIIALRAAAMRARDEAIAAGLKRAARSVVTWFKVLGETLANWPRRQQAYDELRSLTDRELADIGLTRGDIPRVFEPNFSMPARPAANANNAVAKPQAA